ncbi:MAG: hydroxymethylglutaryl-CoA reductase, partial [Promethearchaeota archaeon CR_4]
MWDKFSGFFQLSLADRLSLLQRFCALSTEEITILQDNRGLPVSQADRMVENVIGTFPYPFGVALNFQVNNRDHIVPMV